MSRFLPRRPTRRDESGMTTSEYAVGTIGACTVGGVLVQIAQSEWFNNMIQSVFDKIPTLGFL
ncbi:DUF4244 domain-containing protein [Aeromicrobium alkaliterrae]|uniref:DUF4244 domain-containing protein n=1 Tax=Aeromicrobium alkaliterrae TaxID=302168 RepID=A0ABN2K2S3_9ACTN